MPRIFACLAMGHLLVLIGTGVVGLLRVDPGGAAHMALAVFALILAALIQVATFTYLTVTGKMIMQAANLSGAGVQPVLAVRRLKQRMARWVGLFMLTVVFVTASGAASRWSQTQVHLLAAAIFLVVQLIVYYREFALVCENSVLLGRVLASTQVRRASQQPESNRDGAESAGSGDARMRGHSESF